MGLLGALLAALPDDLAARAVTHTSWVTDRDDSYERLAFLGDSVLSLALTTHLYAPDGPGAGRRPGVLTQLRAQVVSGRSCRGVAERLGLPGRARAAAPPEGGETVDALMQGERPLAEMVEAVIGACVLTFGFARTAEAVVEAFGPEVQQALSTPADAKSRLQELLAQGGRTVEYAVRGEQGPDHRRTFEIAACVDGEDVATGTGRSKKDAEQQAAARALRELGES